MGNCDSKKREGGPYCMVQPMLFSSEGSKSPRLVKTRQNVQLLHPGEGSL